MSSRWTLRRRVRRQVHLLPVIHNSGTESSNGEDSQHDYIPISESSASEDPTSSSDIDSSSESSESVSSGDSTTSQKGI